MLPSPSQLLPHRAPMLLIDEILSVDSQMARCLIRINEKSLFLGPTGVPVWIGIEYMAQCVAAYGGNHSLISSESVGIGFLLGTRKFTAFVEYFPLQIELIVEARLNFGDESISNFECKIFSNSELLAEASLTTFKPNQEILLNLKKGVSLG